ncbi:MAG: hypothetical protein ACRD06_07510 [Terriglobia bacterium]
MAKAKRLVIPEFASEAQEARWYDRHKRQIELALARRMKGNPSLNLRQAAARTKLRPVTIRLAAEDIEAARDLAARKGVGYQTYIKLLLREALQRDAERL